MGGSPRRQKPGQPSEQDLRLWRYITRDAKPLRGPKEVRQPEPIKPPESEVRARPALRASTAAAALTSPRPSPPPELAHGDVTGLDKRRAQRLKRGRLPIEARLDLHGMTQAGAHVALENFVTRSAAMGRRCVLIITGKGRGGEAGVLRRQVPLWLNQANLRSKVLAFDYARPEHGGQGALYLLLRRRRGDEPE